MQRMARAVQHPEAGRANHQAHAAQSAQNLGQAGQLVRRGQIEDIVIDRGQARGRKAQHEAVEGQVVEAAALERVLVVLVVAAVAMAAVQVFQAQHVVCGFGSGRAADIHIAGGGLHILPEAAHAHEQCEDHEQEHRRKDADQQIVREQVVEVVAQIAVPQLANATLRSDGQRKEQEEAGDQCQGQGQAVFLVQLAHGGRPGIVGIGLAAHFGHGLGDVDAEFVRRCVLAGVQAGAAVVAEIGQVMHIGLTELQTARHGREHGAETFAIAAGIADLHHTRHFAFGSGFRWGR